MIVRCKFKVFITSSSLPRVTRNELGFLSAVVAGFLFRRAAGQSGEKPLLSSLQRCMLCVPTSTPGVGEPPDTFFCSVFCSKEASLSEIRSEERYYFYLHLEGEPVKNESPAKMHMVLVKMWIWTPLIFKLELDVLVTHWPGTCFTEPLVSLTVFVLLFRGDGSRDPRQHRRAGPFVVLHALGGTRELSRVDTGFPLGVTTVPESHEMH